jgi:hypothetical protein
LFPTIGFDLLYTLVIVRLGRRDLVWINVTANPTAEWVALQITKAFLWDEVSRYMIRDRDRIYGSVVTRRLRTMGIRDKPIAPASPWQNGFAERLIGSIRRECVDQITVLGEMHLRRVSLQRQPFSASKRLQKMKRLLTSATPPRVRLERRTMVMPQRGLLRQIKWTFNKNMSRCFLVGSTPHH